LEPLDLGSRDPPLTAKHEHEGQRGTREHRDRNGLVPPYGEHDPSDHKQGEQQHARERSAPHNFIGFQASWCRKSGAHR
jgi:hypothetical protein